MKPYVRRKIQVFSDIFVLSALCFSISASALWARPWACLCLLERGGVLSDRIRVLPGCSFLLSLLSFVYLIPSCLSSSSGNRTFPKLRVNLRVSWMYLNRAGIALGDANRVLLHFAPLLRVRCSLSLCRLYALHRCK